VLTQQTYPSWGYMLSENATTVWERWDERTPERSNPFPPFRGFSRCHVALASFSEWLYSRLCGIRPLVELPGFECTMIEPIHPVELDWAEATVTTPFGGLRAAWRRAETAIHYELDVPPGSRAMFRAPAGTVVQLLTSSASPNELRHQCDSAVPSTRPEGVTDETITLGSGRHFISGHRLPD
jgi:alpha-L-rhamnosidase